MVPVIMLTIENGKLAGTEYAFDLPRRCLIGRASDCEVRLPSQLEFLGVSRHHCLLTLDPPAVRVRDCGSRNGTLLNGMQIGRPASWHVPEAMTAFPSLEYELRDGDELTIGSTVFKVHVTVHEDALEPVLQERQDRELCACA